MLQNRISGDIIMTEMAEHEFLNVKSIDSLLSSDLITIATDQAIESNVYISQILTSDVNARIFNDLAHFAKNVVLLGSNSTIEC